MLAFLTRFDMGGVQTLRLSGCKMGVKAGEQLATSRACLAELECLGLRGNGLWAGVANDGSGVPALLRDYCGRLRTLELGGNGLDDAGAASLAEALSQMQTLTSLDLSDGKLSSTGASLLAGLLHSSSRACPGHVRLNAVPQAWNPRLNDFPLVFMQRPLQSFPSYDAWKSSTTGSQTWVRLQYVTQS